MTTKQPRSGKKDAAKPNKPTDWVAIKQQFVNGQMLPSELAREHGIAEGTMRMRVLRGKWQEERDALLQMVTLQAQEKLTAQRIDELAAFNAQSLDLAKTLHGLVSAKFAQAGGMQAAPLSCTELDRLGAALEKAQRIGRLALGVTTAQHGHSGAHGEPMQTVVFLNEHDAERARQLRQKLLDDV